MTLDLRVVSKWHSTLGVDTEHTYRLSITEFSFYDTRWYDRISFNFSYIYKPLLFNPSPPKNYGTTVVSDKKKQKTHLSFYEGVLS